MNEWKFSSIELRKDDYCRIVLQHEEEGWILKANSSSYIRASLYDAVEVADAILEGQFDEIRTVDADSLTIELYSYVDKKNIRIPYSKELLEDLSKSLRISIYGNKIAPFLSGSSKTVYEITSMATEYLKEQTDKKLSIYFAVGDHCSGAVAFKDQPFKENLEAICKRIPIHKNYYYY